MENFPEMLPPILQNAWAWLELHWMQFPIALLVLIIGLWIAGRISRVVEGVLHKRKVEQILAGFIKNIIFYLLVAAVCIAAIDQIGIQVASFLAVLGAAGLAIGLALKDSLSNFAAGVMLILLRYFKVGDYITAGGVSGTVASMTVFHTELTSPDNQRITVPNAQILSGPVTNYTAHPTRRLDMVFSIAYDDDIRQAKEILESIIKDDPRVLPEPAPVIAVGELGASSVDIFCRPWVATGDYWALRWDLLERVKVAYDEAGITIPFPQREVLLRQEKAE